MSEPTGAAIDAALAYCKKIWRGGVRPYKSARNYTIEDFLAGRKSLREDLRIACEALAYISDANRQCGPIYDTDPERARTAIEKLKARGSWLGE